MQEFIEAKVTDNHLKILNIMRSSIKATTLSDICTAEGRSITFQAWTLTSSNELREDYDWPRVPTEFSEAQIKIWQQALTKTFLQPHANNNNRRLKISSILGHRICSSVREKWKWFYSAYYESLYFKKANQW